VLIAVAASPQAVAQADYRWELSGSVQASEVGDEIEGDSAAIISTRFFAPVSAEGPLGLAAFLSRSSYASAGLDGDEQREAITIGGGLSPPAVIEPVREGDGYTLAGRKIWRDSGWFVGGAYDSSDTELSGPSVSATQSELEGYGIVAGKYVAATTALELGVRTADLGTEFGSSAICSFVQCITGTTLTTDSMSLDALHVGRLGAVSYAVSGGVLASEADLRVHSVPAPATSPGLRALINFSGSVAAFTPVSAASVLNDGLLPFERRYAYSASGEVFPTPRIGVRLGYVRWDGDPLLDDGYDVAASWFFRDHVAVRFHYARTNRDNAFFGDLPESNAITMTLLGRL
jgi:hypothetical protein